MTKDKIREQLGRHIYALSTGDVSLLYSMLVALEPTTSDATAHEDHKAICDILLQVLVSHPSPNAPLEKLRAVEVPNPRMQQVLRWYIDTIPGAAFPESMLEAWPSMVPQDKRQQWGHEARSFAGQP